jgi:hypothetical protein
LVGGIDGLRLYLLRKAAAVIAISAGDPQRALGAASAPRAFTTFPMPWT